MRRPQERKGGKPVRTGGEGRLREWAEEVGFTQTGRSLETLLTYREVVNAWPPAKRRGEVSFSVHQVLANLPDRFEVIQERDRWTLTQGLQRAGRSVGDRLKPLDRGEASMVPVEAARAALLDPNVAREVLADPQIRHVIDEARPAEDRAEQARRLVRDPAVARHVVQDNQAAHVANTARPTVESGTLLTKGITVPTWLLIVIIVLVVLAVLGFFGRGRMSR